MPPRATTGARILSQGLASCNSMERARSSIKSGFRQPARRRLAAKPTALITAYTHAPHQFHVPERIRGVNPYTATTKTISPTIRGVRTLTCVDIVPSLLIVDRSLVTASISISIIITSEIGYKHETHPYSDPGFFGFCADRAPNCSRAD